MPLSGGTAGAHDDAMHQGSAKRDVVDGLAGLDSSGFLLAAGAGIQFPRSGSDDVHIYERTSGEEAYAFHRTGANDYTFYIKESNVWKRFQTESMKDVNDGIAGLSASGSIMCPGPSLMLTRNVSDEMYTYERASSEFIVKYTRQGVDDYLMQLKVGGAYRIVQHSGLKDVADGIAGLDANILLLPALLPPCMEEYSNHLGATDNFSQVGVAGNGVTNPDAANHEMDISTGVGAIGHAYFRTKKGWILGAKPLVANFIVQNIVLGVGGERKTFVALKNDFTDKAYNKMCGFYEDGNGDWFAYTREIGSAGSTAITALADGDHCTIVATTSIVKYYVNGVLVATHTANFPTSMLYLGSSVSSATTGTTTAASISVDMMSIKTYV